MINNFQIILNFARKVRFRIILQDFVNIALIILCFFFLVTVAANLLFNFSPLIIIPLLWDISLISSLFLILLSFVYFAFVKKRSLTDVLGKLEKKSKVTHPVVSIALELSTQPPNFFIESTCKQAINQIHSLEPFIPSIIKSKKNLYVSIILFLLMLSSQLLPTTSLLFWKIPFASRTDMNALISPGTISIPKYQKVVLQFKPHKYSLPISHLSIKTLENGDFHSFILHSDSNNQFSYCIDSLKQSIIYQFSYGSERYTSDTVHVVSPPILLGIKVLIHVPQYIGNKTIQLPEGQGDFKTYAGSKITITIQSITLRKASIILGPTTIPMQIAGDHASSTIQVYNNGSYTFSLADTFNQKNDSLPSYQFETIPDEPPVVQINIPGINKDVTTSMKEPVSFQAMDDLGLKKIYLFWSKSGERDTTYNLDFSPPTCTTYVKKEFLWNLSDCHMYPGDTVFYWIKASDSWPFMPKHISSSDTFWFRVPGFEEIQKSIAEGESEAQQTIKNSLKVQDKIQNRIDNFSKSLSKTGEATWEQKQEFSEIKQDLGAQTDSLQNALDDLRKTADDLRSQGDFGNELSQKMEQIQKTIQELMKQYGDSLFSPHQQDESLNWQDMKKAVENAREILPELGKQLDNTLQFLEVLRKDREMASLAMRAENLAKEQSQISSEQNSSNTRKSQNDILNDIKKLQKDIDASSLKKNSPMGLDSASHAIDSLSRKMNSSLQKNQLPEQQSMNEMSGSLLSMADNLKQMISTAQQQKLKKDRELLLSMAHDALSLADWQKQLMAKADDEPNERQNAISQGALNDALNKLATNLDKLKVIPPDTKQQLRQHFQSSKDNLQTTLQSFNQIDSKGSMRQSINSLQMLSNSLINAASSTQQGGSQSSGSDGMMSGLRKLSRQQAAINSATSELLRSLVNGSSGQQGQGSGQNDNKGYKAAQQAAQTAQQKIANELKKLAEKFNNQDEKSIQERLKNLQKEAQDLTGMLNNPQNSITEKQNQFLTRMLQSSLSLHKEGESKDERKSTSSKAIFSGKIIKSNGSELQNADQLYLLKRKALQGNFPESYRPFINAYFDSLGSRYFKLKSSSH